MEIIKRAFQFVKQKAAKVAGVVASFGTVAAVTLSTYATPGDYVVVQSSDLEPILEGAKENIGVILPIGIGLFAIIFGISFIPLILAKFKRG